VNEEHLLSGEFRGRIKSGQQKKVNVRGALTFWRVLREDQVRTVEESEKVRVLTSWRVQRDRRIKSTKEGERVTGTHWQFKFLQSPERVGTAKTSERAKVTYPLESAERWTNQNKNKPASERHSLSGEHRKWETSGRRKILR
jgi:hypothetical protein